MNEKELRDWALLGALHPGLFDDEAEATGRPNFDGGVRGIAPAHRSDPTLRSLLQRHAYREPGGWHTLELEDGADLFFGWACGEPHYPAARRLRGPTASQA